ncbi:MAG: hypothetical protein ACI83H_001947, partial [Glaciecola sp.]
TEISDYFEGAKILPTIKLTNLFNAFFKVFLTIAYNQ